MLSIGSRTCACSVDMGQTACRVLEKVSITSQLAVQADALWRLIMIPVGRLFGPLEEVSYTCMTGCSDLLRRFPDTSAAGGSTRSF